MLSDTVGPFGSTEAGVGEMDRRYYHINRLPSCSAAASTSLEQRAIIGQKLPLVPKQVWSIRVRLEMASKKRDLTLFNMAVDSKLRGCDLVCLTVRNILGGR